MKAATAQRASMFCHFSTSPRNPCLKSVLLLPHPPFSPPTTIQFSLQIYITLREERSTLNATWGLFLKVTPALLCCLSDVSLLSEPAHAALNWFCTTVPFFYISFEFGFLIISLSTNEGTSKTALGTNVDVHLPTGMPEHLSKRWILPCFAYFTLFAPNSISRMSFCYAFYTKLCDLFSRDNCIGKWGYTHLACECVSTHILDKVYVITMHSVGIWVHTLHLQLGNMSVNNT